MNDAFPITTDTRSDPPRLGRVAFVMSDALGECLVSMVLVENLVRHGIDVCVFGAVAHVLREWFPRVTIQPLPARDALRARLAFSQTVFQMREDEPVTNPTDLHPHVRMLHSVVHGEGTRCVAERLADYCRQQLDLANVGIGNGVRAPSDLRHRRHRRRVVMHPQSSRTGAWWSAKRFIRVARRLRARGYDVYFVIAPHERAHWAALDTHRIAAPHFDNLDLLARWIYESGWFIGDDSEIGHLASNLGLPAVTLFPHRGRARRWCHAWSDTQPVLPWRWLPGAASNEAFRQRSLTCGRVLSAFAALVERDALRSRRD